MYGDNVAVLHLLKAAVDPTNVMGLAGGFKFNPPSISFVDQVNPYSMDL